MNSFRCKCKYHRRLILVSAHTMFLVSTPIHTRTRAQSRQIRTRKSQQRLVTISTSMPVVNSTKFGYDLQEDDNIFCLLTFEQIVDLLITILNVVVISADLFLVCVICRFKMLRVRTNMYILNCCILHILFIITFVIAHVSNFDVLPCYRRLYIVETFLALYVVFAFALGLDWFLSVSRPDIIQKYNTVYKYIFVALYTVFFIDGLVLLVICSEVHEVVRYYIFHTLCIISIIAVLILNIRRNTYLQNSSFKTAYSLTVTTIIIVSFLPLECLYLLIYLFNEAGYVVVPFMVIPLLILLIHPVLIIYMLGRQNKDFKIAYKRSFSCCIKRYADENFDGGSDDENDIRDYGVTGFEREAELKLGNLQDTNNGPMKGSNCDNKSTVNE